MKNCRTKDAERNVFFSTLDISDDKYYNSMLKYK